MIQVIARIPFIPGHEAVGQVVAAGRSVQLTPGTRWAKWWVRRQVCLVDPRLLVGQVVTAGRSVQLAPWHQISYVVASSQVSQTEHQHQTGQVVYRSGRPVQLTPRTRWVR
jgi:hypothetical protein